MKKKFIFLIAAMMSFHFFLRAQTAFYTENFQGTHNWTLNTPMGTEGADPNFFTVSDAEGGVLPPGCGVASNGNNTLHVTSVFNPSGGASYDAGGLCGFLFCPQTNRRAESPTINCSGKTSITLSFNFISQGQALLDNAAVLYFDGTNWSTLVNSIKSNVCANSQGQWTSYSVALPSSANNNPSVKIGFKWENNDDGAGTDPSLAVDEITLSGVSSGGAVPVPAFTIASNACTSDTISLSGSATNNPTAWQWQVNPAGPVILNPSAQNASIYFPSSGSYTITLTATNSSGSNSVTQTISITTSPSVTASNNGPYCQGETIFLTAVGTGTYVWTGPLSFSSTQQNPAISNALPLMSGIYTVTITANNCTGVDTTSVVVNPCTAINENEKPEFYVHPNPVTDHFIITAMKPVHANEIKLVDYLGKNSSNWKIRGINEHEISVDVSGLENGVYFLSFSDSRLTKRIIVCH